MSSCCERCLRSTFVQKTHSTLCKHFPAKKDPRPQLTSEVDYQHLPTFGWHLYYGEPLVKYIVRKQINALAKRGADRSSTFLISTHGYLLLSKCLSCSRIRLPYFDNCKGEIVIRTTVRPKLVLWKTMSTLTCLHYVLFD